MGKAAMELRQETIFSTLGALAVNFINDKETDIKHCGLLATATSKAITDLLPGSEEDYAEFIVAYVLEELGDQA